MRLAKHLLIVVLCLGCAGCPSGNDRIFGLFGIYYGALPEGYIWAEYRVPYSDKAKTNPDRAFQAAARGLLGPVRGLEYVKNASPAEFGAATHVAIAGYFAEYYKDGTGKSERFGAVVFPKDQLAWVAQVGPRKEMYDSEQFGPEERVFEFARRYQRHQNAEPNKTVEGAPTPSSR